MHFLVEEVLGLISFRNTSAFTRWTKRGGWMTVDEENVSALFRSRLPFPRAVSVCVFVSCVLSCGWPEGSWGRRLGVLIEWSPEGCRPSLTHKQSSLPQAVSRTTQIFSFIKMHRSRALVLALLLPTLGRWCESETVLHTETYSDDSTATIAQ